MTKKKRVAILGGGVGAMTAAYELTATQELRARYEVTVYQMGWRIGGKGASGRQADAGGRILEHGLHVWSGFYDNAFRIMRACYQTLAETGSDGVYPSVEAAFTPHNNVALGELYKGQWSFLPIEPPMNDEVPGSGGLLLSPWSYFKMAVSFLKEFLQNAEDSLEAPFLGHFYDDLPDWIAHRSDLKSATETKSSPLPIMFNYLESLNDDAGLHSLRDQATVMAMLQHYRSHLQQAHPEGDWVDNPILRRAYIVLDLATTLLSGLIKDKVLLKGTDQLENEEIDHWFKRHGASDIALHSGMLRSIYCYAFGYNKKGMSFDGRHISAGTFLKGTGRLLFTYKGAIFFKMNAGMGDTIFTPLYKVLKQRGVTFAFFHKLEEVKASEDTHSVASLRLTRQADIKGTDYDPFVRVKGLDCWPDQPDYNQLVQGDSLRANKVNLESNWADWDGVGQVELLAGRDFDHVVMGLSVASLPVVASDLIQKSPRWSRMIDTMQTCSTSALQLWLKPDVKDLGWPHGNSILTAYQNEADPNWDLSTWADMTHLEAAEDPSPQDQPGSIAYFCGNYPDPAEIPPFSDHGYPDKAKAAFESRLITWINEEVPIIWPESRADDGGFNWDLLVAPDHLHGPERLKAQYYRINIDPSERYVQSVPGSAETRLRADQSGFDNLVLAGDWTATGINAGCVEAAVMSGLRAASGITGIKPVIVGEQEVEAPPADKPIFALPQSFRAQNNAWPWSSAFGTAKTLALNAIFTLPRDEVAAGLPDGMDLIDNPYSSGARHPVILMFSRQRDMRPNFAPGGMNYLEFIYAIPFVCQKGRNGSDIRPLIYMPRLYLNKNFPVLIGKLGYGFEKQLARISFTKDPDTEGGPARYFYVIEDAKDARPLISAEFNVDGPQGRATSYPHFDQTRLAYELPLVSRFPRGMNLFSFYDFSLGQAGIQAMTAQIRLHDEALPGLSAQTIGLESISQTALGGFFMSSSATLTNPFQTWSLRRQIQAWQDDPVASHQLYSVTDASQDPS